ncbi:hypothetical protein N836_23790 [Leptolyngbya sp. Heron Island J]|uniref:cell envelope integrity protein TolA n=1 Tax=Leptolyngbya sp. Heron Island J TaxID=1385935 RepID=UPI0003B98F28|nr:cell envelope integrity protein TolA [Leptolyngbya sp. Heron Island J]ESA33089.1 hypothetical protein N836_23790 [Leptolyngbya sp. Heron Island J]
MTDTTAFVAGCATTGVAVLVLLLARVGFQTSTPEAETNSTSLEAVVPVPQSPVQTINEGLNEDIRDELERQRDLTAKLENQLVQQEMLARNLENQIKQQQEETRAVLSQLREYQRSVDTLSLQNGQLVEAQVERENSSSVQTIQTTLLWIGGGLLLVMVLGGGVIIICMFLVSGRRREERSMPVVYPFQMPVPPAGYRYYEQEFLPPPPTRHKRANATYYDVD